MDAKRLLCKAVVVSACAWSAMGQATSEPEPATEHRQLTAPPAKTPSTGLNELFPGVRVNLREKIVEFDGEVPIRLDDARAPRVYLEQVVCIKDTKEHESLVVTSVKPSHVHAALLALDLKPGKPSGYRWEGEKGFPVPPEGDEVSVELAYVDREGTARTDRVSQWVLNARTRERWPEGSWVFAGSLVKLRQGQEVYDADGSGTLVGLTSFGTEVLAWPNVFSPDSQVQEPEWIADVAGVPPMGTRVTVRLRAAAAGE